MSQEKKVLLELKKLKKYFPVRRGVQIKALEDVSFSIYDKRQKRTPKLLQFRGFFLVREAGLEPARA